MRIYSRLGAGQVVTEGLEIVDGQVVTVPVAYNPVDPALGLFDVPSDVYNHLMGLHLDGRKAWEDEVERTARLGAEEAARRKDPATLLAAVERGAEGNPALLARLDKLIGLLERDHTPAEAQTIAASLLTDAPADPNGVIDIESTVDPSPGYDHTAPLAPTDPATGVADLIHMPAESTD